MYDWQVKEQYTIVFSIVSTNSLKHKYTSKASIPVQSFYLFKVILHSFSYHAVANHLATLQAYTLL